MKNNQIPRCYSPILTARCPPKGNDGSMNEKLRIEVARIGTLDHETLLDEYRRRFSPTLSFGDVFMRRRLAQAAQEDALGGLDPHEREMLSRVYRRDPKAMPRIKPNATAPVRGVTYTRVYKGRVVSVTSVGYGKFEYEGNVYDSLTACVKAITGTHFSGRKFFNVGGAPCKAK